MNLAWLLPTALVTSAALTHVIRRYAVTYRLIDVPNERSSHVVPTPRGGGVAIVVTFLACLGALAAAGRLDASTTIGIAGAGVIAGLVGFADDIWQIGAWPRLVVHFAAAIWLLAWIGLPPVQVLGVVVVPGWAVHAVAAFGLVWLLNLYNFMDGIDGIAGVEAVSVGLSAAVLMLLPTPVHDGWVLPALLSMAALGFLIWNWPPAGIFMGDAGSGFLGLTLGALAVQTSLGMPQLLWSWGILLGVFIVDATVTLARRLRAGRRPYEAHRTHAYQQAAIRHGHKRVILAVGAINVCWLLPIALAVATLRLDGLVGMALAYVPLVWLGFAYNAGMAITPPVSVTAAP
jgi:Fuc2NAc and GlcNAc transferase